MSLSACYFSKEFTAYGASIAVIVREIREFRFKVFRKTYRAIKRVIFCSINPPEVYELKGVKKLLIVAFFFLLSFKSFGFDMPTDKISPAKEITSNTSEYKSQNDLNRKGKNMKYFAHYVFPFGLGFLIGCGTAIFIYRKHSNYLIKKAIGDER